MAKGGAVLARVRKICLSLPDTKETMTWGKPHFRVGEKIFAGCSERDGRPVVGFKLKMEHAATMVRDARFEPAPYVGHKGWVSMDAAGVKDWDEVKSLIFESYVLIAPKRSLAKLGVIAVPKKSARGKANTVAPRNKKLTGRNRKNSP